MEDVINPNNDFEFSRIRISTPRPLQGGHMLQNYSIWIRL